MKRISVWFLILTFSALLARAQDDAAQQQLDKLSGQIQDLQDAQAQQAKRLAALEKEINDLQGQASASGGSTANSDDVKKLAEQVQVLRDDPNIGLVSSDAYIIEHEKVVPGLSFLDIYSGIRFGEAMSGDLWEELLFDNFIVTSTVLLRRSLIDRAGLFSTSEMQRISQDYDLWLRIAAISDIYYLPKNLAYYRTAGGLHNGETMQMYWNGMLDLFTGLSAYLSSIGSKKGSVDLANRRVFEMKSYISLSNRDIVRSFVNLSGYFYYRLKAAMAL